MMRCLAFVVGGLLLVGGSGAQRTSRSVLKGADLVKLINELPSDFAAVEKSHIAYQAIVEKSLANQASLYRRSEQVAKQAEALARGRQDPGALKLLAESQKMQEMNMSFNLQYLAIQQKMQDESRRFTLLSNIMKTKHDTAKNSISNVR